MTNTASDPNSQVHLLDHPLVQHKLTLLRKKDTDSKKFRELVKELAILIAYEATADLEVEPYTVETPLALASGFRLKGEIGLMQLTPGAVEEWRQRADGGAE